jgi:fatty acid desaturase
MGKAKREAKRARREARRSGHDEAFLASERLQRRHLRRRRILLVVVPALTAMVAAGLHYGMGNGRAAGVVLLLGIAVFFLLGLSSIGSSVQRRDRDRAGSIDFGNRR